MSFQDQGLSLWIGANDLDIEGQFRWESSDTVMTLTDWVPSDPNNADGFEHCVALHLDHMGAMVDANCETLWHGVCEFAVN